jgi:ABC-2 type transport system permease protein
LPEGNIDGEYDWFVFWTSIPYCTYSAIRFTSALSDNQIVAFIISVFVCFFFYFGFDGLASISRLNMITSLGMQDHFKSMGVIDTRDILYFVSLTVFLLTVYKLKSLKL